MMVDTMTPEEIAVEDAKRVWYRIRDHKTGKRIDAEPKSANGIVAKWGDAQDAATAIANKLQKPVTLESKSTIIWGHPELDRYKTFTVVPENFKIIRLPKKAAS